MKKFLLGVDGGNTKTEYLLHSIEGEQIDLLRAGTCSHENFPDGFDGAERVMREHLAELLGRNKLEVADIAAAGFGLAGADSPWQIDELKKRVEAMGFSRYGLANDGILGIKAACAGGVGICAVNGTGTVVMGADERGTILQVGGHGWMTGDGAGGSFICGSIFAAAYNFIYRCGENSAMFPELLKLFGAPQNDFIAMIKSYGPYQKNAVDVIQIGAAAAISGDATAKKIFDSVGESIGKSVAGCIRNLVFENAGSPENPIDVVLVGSIWHKISYPGMTAVFAETARSLAGKHIRTVKPETPPAAGGVAWAREILAALK